jgi:hypothetical protein
MPTFATSERRARRASGLAAAGRELLLVAALFLAYEAGRLFVNDQAAAAVGNAGRLWDLERWLRLPGETTVQNVLLGHDLAVAVANRYYVYVHFPATAVCLIWLYWRHRDQYRWTRTVLAWLTGAGLALHLIFPLAPPRLMPGLGLVDTVTRFGPAVYGPPETDNLSNQYAAMPSLHVGWAIVVGIALTVVTGHRWRALWMAHPLITVLVVVATGNHYWLDAAAAAGLILLIARLTPARPDVAGRSFPLPRQRRPTDAGG